jgi:hypothetical protein
VDHAGNTRLSSTLANATRNRFPTDGLKWLGGAVAGAPAGLPGRAG